MAKQFEFKFICKDCGLKIEQDKDLSKDNWDAYNMKCPDCGGKVKIEVNKEVE